MMSLSSLLQPLMWSFEIHLNLFQSKIILICPLIQAILENNPISLVTPVHFESSYEKILVNSIRNYGCDHYRDGIFQKNPNWILDQWICIFSWTKCFCRSTPTVATLYMLYRKLYVYLIMIIIYKIKNKRAYSNMIYRVS